MILNRSIVTTVIKYPNSRPLVFFGDICLTSYQKDKITILCYKIPGGGFKYTDLIIFCNSSYPNLDSHPLSISSI